MQEPRLLLATDAWFPQVNGVVRTLSNTIEQLESRGMKVQVVHPGLFRSIPCPLYPEISLAFPLRSKLLRMIEEFSPDHIHIATEGPVGFQMRGLCNTRRFQFTSAFHTMFPEYLWHIAKVPPVLTWPVVRRFHARASRTLVPTKSVKSILEERGFQNLVCWSRGIDSSLFYPRSPETFDFPRPLLLYVGRVSREKNIEAFLSLDVDGTKLVIGDGPARRTLEARYPQAVFLGYRKGDELARAYSSADLFVFPSRTDTFGNVILEALACGVPVAAYPTSGPLDILVDKRLGVCHENLSEAITQSLEWADREYCAQYARGYSWEAATDTFQGALVPALYAPKNLASSSCSESDR